MKVSEQNKELDVQLTHEETVELQNKRWLYNHEEDVLILFDKEEKQYSLFKGVSTKAPNTGWCLNLKL